VPDELEAVLRLVADGVLTPDQAAPIIEALTRAERDATEAVHGGRHAQRRLDRARRRIARAGHRMERLLSDEEAGSTRRGRQLRIRVTEHGRQVVNLRIPVGFIDAALRAVPGIGGEQRDRIREAVAAGTFGPIIDVEDPDGDGVLISVE
jgi:hypothetical protein